MAVTRRQTSKGETQEYHYRFMSGGKLYYGVCEGCTSELAAKRYEAAKRKTASELAAQKSVKALVENFRDELTGGARVPLVDAFELSLKKPSRRKSSQKQLEGKRSYWRDYLAFMAARHPEAVNLTDVTVAHAEEYVQQLRTEGRFDKAVSPKNATTYKVVGVLSPRSANVFHQTVAEVFAKLANDAGLLVNPFKTVLKTADDSESREAFTETELATISKNLTPFVKPIFVIGATTGLREGDICTLKWTDVDIEAGFISRRTRKTGITVEIPITLPLRTFLSEQWQASGHLDFVLPEHAAMYKDHSGGITWRFKRFLEGLGIKTTRAIPGRGREVSIKDVHSLRHTFCYYAGLHGIPLPVVQSLVGHMTPEMTKHYQAHADREAKRKMMGLLPDLMALPAAEGGEDVAALRRGVMALAATASGEQLRRMMEAGKANMQSLAGV